jgi:lysophospholipase L1-like esterase
VSRPAKRAALAVAATVGAVVFAERLLGGPLRPQITVERDAAWQEATRAMHLALHEADGELIYVPRPGARVEMDYGVAAFNDQGLREEGHVPEAPGSDVRVAVLGDSLVWGELLAREDAVPAALDRALGEGFEVLNFGVTGYATAQEAGWYRRTVRRFSPDVVVVVFCLNDFLVMSGPLHLYGDAAAEEAWAAERAWLDAVAPIRNETVSAAWLRERRGPGSQVLAAVRHVWRWHRLFSMPGGYVDEIRLAAGSASRASAVRAGLAQLGEDLAADGVPGVLVVSPALYWWHRYQWDDVHADVRAMAEGAGFEVVDPIEAWRGGDPAPLRFGGDNLHYTPEGARRIAAVIAPRVRARAPIRPRSLPRGP